MRTDAVIDHRQVLCPNASLLGFGKGTARRGDLIVYREGEHTRTARMVGRVAYAPPLNGDAKPIKGYLLVLALADNAAFCYERWVAPADVLEVREFPTDFLTWFASPLKHSADMYRRLSDYGTLSALYVDKVDAHVAEWSNKPTEVSS